LGIQLSRRAEAEVALAFVAIDAVRKRELAACAELVCDEALPVSWDLMVRFHCFFVFQAMSAWFVLSQVQGVFRRPVTPWVLKYLCV